MHKNNTKNHISLAHFVVQKREALGLSVEDLADKSGLSVNEINSIEQGMDLFLATTVRQKLAKGLKIDNKEIKKHEKKTDFSIATKAQNDEIREQILLNSTNPNFNANIQYMGNNYLPVYYNYYNFYFNILRKISVKIKRL